MNNQIPSPVMGVMSDALSDVLTHAEIDSLFAYADAPGDPPEGNKVAKSMAWMRRINKQHDAPLKALAVLLESILGKEPWRSEDAAMWQTSDEPEWSIKLRGHQDRIRSALERAGLSYMLIGFSSNGVGTTATKSLGDMVARRGLSAVEVEMKRALKQVEDDPNAAAQYAANVLCPSLDSLRQMVF